MPEIIEKPQSSGLLHNKKSPINRLSLLIICIIASVIVGIIVSTIVWFNVQLSPANSKSVQLVKVTIASGSTSDQISKVLEKQSIIRSSSAFSIYLRIFGKSNILKAGTYRLSPAETVSNIVDHLSKGTTDQFSIMFYPGATLVDNYTKLGQKKYDVTTMLQNAGFTDQEIKSALNKTYDNPLFADKPVSADLEGYIYGETYNFNTGATVSDILKGTFDEFYKVVQDNNLVKDFASHELNLYEGITLASIVQREINSPQGNQPSTDQKQAAQVFYSRLKQGWPLGSDVTSIYIAHKTGQEPDYGLASPYNTRISIGLPPGPIAVPGITALLAIAQPATTDYWYFLSGDDGVMHFAFTNPEHETNITNYCKETCK